LRSLLPSRSICRILKKQPLSTKLFYDRLIGRNNPKVTHHLMLTPLVDTYTFDAFNKWATGKLPTTYDEKLLYWQPCMYCAGEPIELRKPPEGPDEPFLLHAFKSFQIIVDSAEEKINLRIIARLYQHSFGDDEDLCWEDLKNWNDEELYFILKKSLTCYMQ
jgi:hypothetical protein